MMSAVTGDMFSLVGKVAVVTGGTRGIGEEIARAYAKAGARVVICSRKQAAVDRTIERIRQHGAEVLRMSVDISSAEDREKLIESTLDWGQRLDILVNNAGANPEFGGLEHLTEPEFDKVINVNLKASLFLSQIAYKRWMKYHGGVILNVSSIGGISAPRASMDTT